MNPPGNFALLLNGKEVASGGDAFEFFETARIGECDCPEGESLFTFSALTTYITEAVWSLSYQKGLEEYLGGTMTYDYDSPKAFIEECVPDDCWVLNLYPSDPLWESEYHYIDECLAYLVDDFFRFDVLYNKEVVHMGETQEFCHSSILFGNCAPVKTTQCNDDSALVKVEIKLDDQPWKTTWSMSSNETVHINGGPYYQKNGTVVSESCIPLNTCYYFLRSETDAGLDEFKVYLDGIKVNAEGGEFCS